MIEFGDFQFLDLSNRDLWIWGLLDFQSWDLGIVGSLGVFLWGGNFNGKFDFQKNGQVIISFSHHIKTV